MDPQIQEVLDHYLITRLINEYCHGCDRLDELRMAGVYAEDSWDDHGANKCSGQELSRRVMKELPHTEVCSHMMGQTLINSRADEAGAESVFLATIVTRRPDGVALCNQLGGRYVDSLIKQDGAWKIKHRVCVRDWSISHEVTVDWLDHGCHVKGRRDNDDPSFAALGLRHSSAVTG